MKQALRVEEILVHNLSEEEKQLCTQLLNLVNNWFTSIFKKQKHKTFEEIYKENME